MLRRAARHGRLLGIRGCFLDTLCDTVVQENRGAYPALAERLEYIRKTIRTEEERFGQTIDAGLGILEKMLEHVSGGTLDGASIFRLYDTFGFPPDLTKEITAEHGINIDEDEFKRLMQQQKERARAARAGLGDVGWTDASGDLIDKTVKTVFTGYDELSCGCEIRTILADDESVSVLAGGRAVLVLDRTPFYAEGGGQVGDSGEIITDTGVFRVEDTKKTPEGQYLHIGFVASGSVALGAARAEVNLPRRRAIMRNHSSVHLLQAALRRVLGTHVEQSGSYVDENRARFDFTHTAALTPDELQQVELLVNEQILAGSAVTATEMPIDEAKKLGAMALFGEKYGDVVRVVRMGDFSVELCGGTHIDDTAKIGMFKILGESSVASGVRRIEAVTGLNTLGLLHAQENSLLAMRAVLKANSVDELVNKAEALQNEFTEALSGLSDAQDMGMDEDTIALIEDYLDGRLEVFGQMWQQIPLAKREHIGVIPLTRKKVPYVAVVTGAVGDRLCGINSAAATYGQYQIDTLFATNFNALINQIQARIWLYAANLPYLRAHTLQYGHDLVIQANALDAAAAVNHQHLLSVAGNLFAQVRKSGFTKDDFRRVLKNKINHFIYLPFRQWFKFIVTPNG